jgi:hypothetical protein
MGFEASVFKNVNNVFSRFIRINPDPSFPTPLIPPLYPSGKLVFHRGWNENPTPGGGSRV